jgi:F0F1-type ATP synthase epsilon subunit
MKTILVPTELVVTVKSPEKTFFQGKAIAITSMNKEGTFDILPYHTNFISLISKTLIIHESKTSHITIPMEAGIMKVWENIVHIYLGIASS